MSSSVDNVDIEKAEPVVIHVEKGAPLEEQAPSAVSSPTDVAVVPSSNRCRRLLLGLLVAASIALVAVGLTIGISKRNQNAIIPNAADTTSSNNDSTQSTPPPSTLNPHLEFLCQQQDLEACHMACTSAMCCFDTASTECSVPKQHCGHYAPCYVLVDNTNHDKDEQQQETDETSATDEDTEGGYSLPGSDITSNGDNLKEPTALVQEICNSGYMEVSNITCEEACWSANCCYWTGEDGCYENHQQVCDLWKDAGCFVFSDPFGGGDDPDDAKEGEP